MTWHGSQGHHVGTGLYGKQADETDLAIRELAHINTRKTRLLYELQLVAVCPRPNK